MTPRRPHAVRIIVALLVSAVVSSLGSCVVSIPARPVVSSVAGHR